MLLYLANGENEIRIANVLRQIKSGDISEVARGEPLVAIGAFCLMPNHFHILIKQLVEGGISRFMLKLQTDYSMYFNRKYDRTGSLFQGPFRSTLVDSDRYLAYLYSYIHLNPAKLKDPLWKERPGSQSHIMEFVESYPYSSYGDYLSGKHVIVNPAQFPTYFSARSEVTSHISDWLRMGPFDQVEQG